MNPLGMVHIMLFPKVSTINALRVSSMVLFFFYVACTWFTRIEALLKTVDWSSA